MPDALLWLVSDEARYVAGVARQIDGGFREKALRGRVA
jgi:hypothetical protein